MKSIQNSACIDKQGNALELPNLAAKQLEPLFCSPDQEEWTLESVLNPKHITPGDALQSLSVRGFEQHSNAQWNAQRCAHRLNLGARYFSAEQLEAARVEQEQEQATAEKFFFFVHAEDGMPLEAWQAQTQLLGELLEEAKADKDGWRWERLTVEDLLGALEEMEVSDC